MKKKPGKKGKKRRPRSRPDCRRQTGFSQIDETVAARQREMVIETVAAGKTAGRALELAAGAIIWAEHLVGLYEAENRLPRPIVCQPGCCFCCYNQIEVTPPEALLLGDFVARSFSPEDRRSLVARVEELVKIQAGKQKKDLAKIRRQLACAFLEGGKCLVYPVRPLVCRAMHALDAGECEASWQAQDLGAAAHYAHRRLFTVSVVKGLLDGCRALGCQAGTLDLAGALADFFTQPDPVARWIQGKEVFSRS